MESAPSQQYAQQRGMSLNFYGENMHPPSSIGASMQSLHLPTQDQREPYQYIVNQNVMLQANVERLLREVAGLKKEESVLEKAKEELEEEMDSLEKSKTVMKGYLRNEIELVKYSSDLIKYYESNFSSFSDTCKKLRKKAILHFSGFGIYLLSSITVYYIGFQNFYFYLLHYSVCFILLIHFSKLVKIFLCIQHDFLNLPKTTFVTSKKNKIKETEKANDYIGDLIDSL